LLLKVVFGFVELPWSKRRKEFENQTLLTGKIALVIDDIAQKCHQADAERGRDWGPTSNSYKSSCSEFFFPISCSHSITWKLPRKPLSLAAAVVSICCLKVS
jgi:hypothetical protein